MGVKALRAGLDALGLECDELQAQSFMLYLAELKRWNKAYNLTSIKDDAGIILKHFIDSSIYLLALSPEDKYIADIGTGGGFPGIPMKILRPELRMTLVEPTGKKTAFLRNMVHKLELSDTEVLNMRVQDTPELEVDVAVSRAFCSARDFVERAAHIIRPGGKMILSKGPRAEEEATELKDMDINYVTRKVKLPASDMTRTLITISL
jgi:16S rRNA (guanine527-N7)-methyltransferase